MLGSTKAFSGIGVDDIDAARAFYGDTLGIRLSDKPMGGMFDLELEDGARPTLVYERPGNVPAEYTVLNFAVEDVGATVRALAARGVVFERYEGMPQDDDGVMRGNGPDIAWCKDPAGNVLSVIAA